MRLALFGVELEENLGVRSIHAAAVAAGHEAEIFSLRDQADLEPLVAAMLAWKPDVVGLSMIFTRTARDYVGLARELRRLGFKGHLTAGGHFAALNAEALLGEVDALDSVLHGEGEEAVLDLMAHLDHLEAVQGLTRRLPGGGFSTSPPRPALEDLDARPRSTRPPEFDRYLGLPVANMLGSRGCYAACTFCSLAAWSEAAGLPRVRLRTPEAVADEMADLFHHRGVRLFNFHDDNFFLRNKAETLARFRALRKRLDERKVGRIGLQVKARPDSIDAEVAKELEALGVYRVFLGVDSNSVRGLKALGRGIRGTQNHVALQLLLERGFHVTFNLLAFEPDCTLQDLEDNLAFVEQYPQVPVNIVRTEVYGGTPLEARLRALGRLEGDYFGYDYKMADPAAQRAWDVFSPVFRERSFTGEGANLRAMAVDCLFQVLVHFWPQHGTPELRARVKGFVAEVNASNVELWRAVLDFAKTESTEEERAAFAAKLQQARKPLDAGLLEKANALLAHFAELSQGGPGESATPGLKRGRSVSGVVVALLSVAVVGCLGATALAALFGDNIKALFSMSTELAGETSVQQRKKQPPPPKKQLSDFGKDGY